MTAFNEQAVKKWSLNSYFITEVMLLASRTLHLPLSISDIDVGRQPSQITFLPCCKHAWCSALLIQVFPTIDSGSHYSKKFLVKWIKLFRNCCTFCLGQELLVKSKLKMVQSCSNFADFSKIRNK